MAAKKTIDDFLKMKEQGEKIAAVVVYDYHTASLLEEAGIDWMLGAGDSVEMSIYGKKNTLGGKMSRMLDHGNAASRGAPNVCDVNDMPYGADQTPEMAAKNAIRFRKAGADIVKIERGRKVVGQIKAMVNAGVIVMAHEGLSPQTKKAKLQGATAKEGMEIILDVRAAVEAGASAILLEAVPAELAKLITDEFENEPVLIFGIGAGPYVHGQLLLDFDLFGKGGKYTVFYPKFGKCYVEQAIQVIETANHIKRLSKDKEILLNLANITFYALKEYVREVKAGVFPAEEHCYHMKDGEYEKLKVTLKAEKRSEKEEISRKIENTV